MNQYVLGFAFNADLSKVVLIKKRPTHRIHPNLWNGIGGRVITGQGFRHAMASAFLREAGVQTEAQDWYGFHKHIYRHGVIIRCYAARLDDSLFNAVATQGDEAIEAWDYPRALRTACGLTLMIDEQTVADVSYLLPMARLHMAMPPADWNIG